MVVHHGHCDLFSHVFTPKDPSDYSLGGLYTNSRGELVGNFEKEL